MLNIKLLTLLRFRSLICILCTCKVCKWNNNVKKNNNDNKYTAVMKNGVSQIHFYTSINNFWRSGEEEEEKDIIL